MRYSQRMSPDHRRYLVLEQGLGAALINFVLNGIIAWTMFHGLEVVPLWGEQSIGGDTIGTTFLLPLITCLVVTPLARGQIRSGRLKPLGWTPASHPALGRLPAGTFRRALALGAMCTLIVAPITLSLLASQLAAMSFWRFIAFKATFAAVLAAAVTPLIALWAIAQTPVETAPA